ncbi:MAG: lytic transglycosylase domain-containing protein [Deltaproteobacteria bacterium]|nr:lytic transglycosylase domain-containing protein [Deltaproteobacteria bacterium]
MRLLKLFIFILLTSFFTFSFYVISESFAKDKNEGSENHWLKQNKKKNKKKEIVSQDHNQLSEKGDRKLVSFQFPVPDTLKPNIEFWKKIYASYGLNERVFHDTEHLEVIYSVLNLDEIADENNDADPIILPSKKERKSRIEAEKNRIRNILLKLAEGGFDLKDLNEEEKKIYHLFDKIDEVDKFKNAAEPGRIRAQTGQKDRFIQAIQASGAYLTEIEDILSSHGVPYEVSRLLFVESMFNLKARSHVGASGLWQFMPATGRLFIKVGSLVDERNDPIIATHAAAQLLKMNLEKLGNWPLAINAYHSGTQTLMNAKEALSTDDIGVITSQYRGGIYKFASRNYYAEFLAALEIANHYKDYFGEIQRDPRFTYEVVSFESPIRLKDLVGVVGLDLETLRQMNPAYHSSFFYSQKPLPAGYEIKVPKGMGESFKKIASETAIRKEGVKIDSVSVQ